MASARTEPTMIDAPMIDAPITNIAQSTGSTFSKELTGLIEEGKLTLNQARKIIVSWSHECLTDTPEVGDYVLGSDIDGSPMRSFGVGFLHSITTPENPHQETTYTIQAEGRKYEGFYKVKKISLNEGKYFVKYGWQIYLASCPSLWWRLSALRKGKNDPENYLLAADQSDLDSYATKLDRRYVESHNFMESIGMGHENLFKFPDIPTQ